MQEGFRDTWGFARYRREAGCARNWPHAGRATRPLQSSDWPAIEALDTPAFGASRLALLRALAQRLPIAARVVEEGGRLRGFVFGRDGREATQIGPLVADDDATAMRLLRDVLAPARAAVYIDLLDRQPGACCPGCSCRGSPFSARSPACCTAAPRAPVAPGDSETVVLVAGPELG